MKQSVRHSQIVEMVIQNGYVSTEELVTIFDVSSQTIRRDLNELAEENLIRRHHGGAASPSSSENSDYHDRKHIFSLEKQLIGKKAATLIPNGASLFIDIGTTPEAVAHALLHHKDLCIVTNNLNAAHMLMHKTDFQITLAGGILRPDGGIIGDTTTKFISRFRLDFAILGISSIEKDGTLLDYDYNEVQVKRAIMDSARQTILVTDHSKFGRSAIVRLGSLSEIQYLLTDEQPSAEILDLIYRKNVQLEICKEG